MSFSPLFTDELERELNKKSSLEFDDWEKGAVLKELNDRYFLNSPNLFFQEENEEFNKYRKAPIGKIAEVIVDKYQETELTYEVGIEVEKGTPVIGESANYRITVKNQRNYKKAQFEYRAQLEEVQEDIKGIEDFLSDRNIKTTIETNLI
ncbi:MAG: hypothetical protein ABEJ98_06085 [Candidatus Nanohaloarchaea archaeon]